MKAQPPSFDVLGVRVDAITMTDALATLDRLLRTRARGYLVFCTVSSILSARDDHDVARAMSKAALVTPDGMPLVWLGKSRANTPVERVYGPDFLRAVLERGVPLRHFFYGGASGVPEQVAEAVGRYEGCEVVGTYSPPTLEPGSIDHDAIPIINEARPDVVWVGLGHPKQELWMSVMSPELDVPVLVGVGAAFDFLAGTKREAPGWMKRAGLQWVHRLASEPSRLWRRYIFGNARFLFLLARERLSGHR